MGKCKIHDVSKVYDLKYYIIRSFFRHLRNVSLESDINKPNIEFTADGDLKSTELKIMNLRPGLNTKSIVWEEVK